MEARNGGDAEDPHGLRGWRLAGRTRKLAGLVAGANLIGLVLLLLAAPASGQEVGDKEQDAPRSRDEAQEDSGGEAAEIPYEVTVVGVEESSLLELLEASSQLIALEERPPATLARLRLRAEEDKERLIAALRSEGYYEATVGIRVDDRTRPVPVTIEVETGAQYHISAYVLEYEGADQPDLSERPDPREFGIEVGMPARAPDIVAAEETWVSLMAERGFPLAEVRDRKAVIDRDDDTMRVTVAVQPGPRARFGPVGIEGVEQVEEQHVMTLVPWRQGEPYDSRKIEELRRELSASGLFSSVTVKPADAVEGGGSLPVAVRVVEAPHRSFGFGASFATDIGPGGEIFWEHRNFFGQGEQLRLSLTGAKIEQSVEARFRKPEFLRRDQALLVNFEASNKDTDAFDEQSVSGFAGIEFPLTEEWRATVGLAPEYTQVEDDDGKRQFFIAGLPASAARDASDDLLNPTRGTRLDLALTPYYGTGDDELTFLTGVVAGSAYHSVDEESRFVLAGRTRIGALGGESTEQVPASKRFFAGGGGSIRGFEFQSAGPLDGDDDPLGGRSLLEINAELRVRVTDTIGVVPFVDGGTVFDSSFPDFEETLRWGAGLGLRYFTGFGPLRADFAVPLNRRSSDDAFQFYVSLGQAF